MIRYGKEVKIPEELVSLLEQQKRQFKATEKKKLSARPSKQKFKDFMFNSLLGISQVFLVICGLFMVVSKAFEKKAYSFRPKLCLEDGICLNNSLIPYYNKDKIGKKLVEFATARDVRPCDAVEKVGAVSMHGQTWTENADPDKVYPMVLGRIGMDCKEIPEVVKANLVNISPTKLTFYNLKEDEYDKRAQEMVDRKVEEINKEVGKA